MTEYGWFDGGWFGGDEAPAHDPGLDVPCPVCGEPLATGRRRTISFLVDAQPERSYFFRAHKACADAHPERMTQIECDVVDLIANGVQ